MEPTDREVDAGDDHYPAVRRWPAQVLEACRNAVQQNGAASFDFIASNHVEAVMENGHENGSINNEQTRQQLNGLNLMRTAFQQNHVKQESQNTDASPSSGESNGGDSPQDPPSPAYNTSHANLPYATTAEGAGDALAQIQKMQLQDLKVGDYDVRHLASMYEKNFPSLPFQPPILSQQSGFLIPGSNRPVVISPNSAHSSEGSNSSTQNPLTFEEQFKQCSQRFQEQLMKDLEKARLDFISVLSSSVQQRENEAENTDKFNPPALPLHAQLMQNLVQAASGPIFVPTTCVPESENTIINNNPRTHIFHPHFMKYLAQSELEPVYMPTTNVQQTENKVGDNEKSNHVGGLPAELMQNLAHAIPGPMSVPSINGEKSENEIEDNSNLNPIALHLQMMQKLMHVVSDSISTPTISGQQSENETENNSKFNPIAQLFHAHMIQKLALAVPDPTSVTSISGQQNENEIGNNSSFNPIDQLLNAQLMQTQTVQDSVNVPSITGQQSENEIVDYSKLNQIAQLFHTHMMQAQGVQDSMSVSSASGQESENKSENTDNSDQKTKTVKKSVNAEALYDLDPNDQERKAFLDDLFSFMQRIGKPINRLPIMAKSVLDLYQLYKLVIARGGLVEVINKKLWQEIIKGLNLPSTITSAAFTLRTQSKYTSTSTANSLRKNYEKVLYEYEKDKFNLSSDWEKDEAIEKLSRKKNIQKPALHLQTKCQQKSFSSDSGNSSIGTGSPECSPNEPVLYPNPIALASALQALQGKMYMRYLFPYETEKFGFSSEAELNAAIDGNKREGRRSSYGHPYMPRSSPNRQNDGSPQMMSARQALGLPNGNPGLNPGQPFQFTQQFPQLNGLNGSMVSPVMPSEFHNRLLDFINKGAGLPGLSGAPGLPIGPGAVAFNNQLWNAVNNNHSTINHAINNVKPPQEEALNLSSSPPLGSNDSQPGPSQETQHQPGKRQRDDSMETEPEVSPRRMRMDQEAPTQHVATSIKIQSRPGDGRNPEGLVVTIEVNGISYQGLLFSQAPKDE